MRKVEHLSEFPKECYVAQFVGKSYDEAVGLANKSVLPITMYFEQQRINYSKISTILVSYHKENKE
jgi:hypothetical protein